MDNLEMKRAEIIHHHLAWKTNSEIVKARKLFKVNYNLVKRTIKPSFHPPFKSFRYLQNVYICT